ncbi:unnamed protein product [Amoebophrya sp. A25]|nr:unnamed protein product [Amoebophrya sp. A25]|eukprot:GSA25T00000222001.1
MPQISDALEKRLAAFFDVYDIDGNGDIDISEFNKIEVRLEVQSTEGNQIWGLAAMDADSADGGTILFPTFRTRMLRVMHMASLPEEIFIRKINERISLIISERKLMGLTYHYGVRCMIQKLFRAFDADHGGEIEAEEWMIATKVVASGLTEKSGIPIDTAKYHGADESGDGSIDPDEFMQFMYEVLAPIGEKFSGDEIEEMLKHVHSIVPHGVAERMIRIPVYSAFPDVILNRKNEWQHPNQKAKSTDGWAEVIELAIDPIVMKTSSDIKEMMNMKLNLPYATEMTIFWKKSVNDMQFQLLPDGGEEFRLVWKDMQKSTGVKQLWVKNLRVAPLLDGCKKVEVITDEAQIEEIQKKMSGQRAGVLDFEDLVHKQRDYPIKGTMRVGLGESIMCEFPGSNTNQKYPYRVEAYVRGTDLITGVVEEKLEKAVKKGPPADYTLRWSFVGEGKVGEAKIIVEVGWDNFEPEIDLEGGSNPYRNETVFQFIADVICTDEVPKPGVKTNVYWHGLIWDGTQTKATKPK